MARRTGLVPWYKLWSALVRPCPDSDHRRLTPSSLASNRVTRDPCSIIFTSPTSPLFLKDRDQEHLHQISVWALKRGRVSVPLSRILRALQSLQRQEHHLSARAIFSDTTQDGETQIPSGCRSSTPFCLLRSFILLSCHSGSCGGS
jgi:hypothetical protein